MYELNKKQATSKWNKYNEATKFFFENKYKEALELFNDFYSENTTDKPTAHLMRLCEASL